MFIPNSIDDILNTTRTIYGSGDTQTTNTYYYHKNQLGSIIAITNAQGTAIEEYRYDSFGKASIRDTNSNIWKDFTTSTTGNTRLFTGREYDSETNLYYYRARYYSASLGRFISRDPIGTRDDVNLYGYVGNNPVKYSDAMGLEKAILSIYADRGDNGFTSGHAWIELEYKGEKHSYGFYPFIFLQIDIELNNKGENKKYNNYVSESINITKLDYDNLLSSIEADLQTDWTDQVFHNPWAEAGFCVGWAVKNWNSVVNQDLKLDIWTASPNTLANEIEGRN